MQYLRNFSSFTSLSLSLSVCLSVRPSFFSFQYTSSDLSFFDPRATANITQFRQTALFISAGVTLTRTWQKLQQYHTFVHTTAHICYENYNFCFTASQQKFPSWPAPVNALCSFLQSPQKQGLLGFCLTVQHISSFYS